MSKARQMADLLDSGGDIASGALDNIPANSIGADELNVTGNGTSAQYLGSDADGTFTWTSVSSDPTMGGDLTGTASNAQLGAGSVDATALAADAVTGAKLADNIINSEHYVDGSIDNEHLASASVDTVKLSDLSITTAKLADSSITAAKINNGTITNAKLSASGTASSTTFLAGNNTWGTPSGGKVLQCKHVLNTTRHNITTGTATYSGVSGFTISITPSSTSSKILISGHVSTVNPGDHNGRGTMHRIKRGSTVVGNATSYGSRLAGNSGSAQGYNMEAPGTPINHLDSPATTSAITYSVEVAPLQHNVIQVNMAPADSNAISSGAVTSSFWVMEIGA